jgi:hypothetical protein
MFPDSIWTYCVRIDGQCETTPVMQVFLVYLVTCAEVFTALESSLQPTAWELEMTSTGFWFVIGATAAMFALWLAANIFLVAGEGATEIVPLSTRPNWRARVNAAMLMLPVVAGLGAALLLH